MAAVKGKKTKQIETAERTAVVQAVKGLNLSKVIADLGDAQIYVQKSLGELTATLSDKLNQIETLDTAISVKKDELKALHDIEVAATALDDLQAQIEADEKDWEARGLERADTWLAEDNERETVRSREEAEYAYNLQQDRQKSQDEWDAMTAKRRRDEAIYVEEKQKEWKKREDDLKAQEQEMIDLRARVAGIPAEIESAVKKEVAIESNRLKRDYTQELTLARKDSETEKRISDAAIASSEQTIARLQQENERLQSEVKAANARAETIAAKAVEASAGRQALDAVQRQTEVLGQTAGKGR